MLPAVRGSSGNDAAADDSSGAFPGTSPLSAPSPGFSPCPVTRTVSMRFTATRMAGCPCSTTAYSPATYSFPGACAPAIMRCCSRSAIPAPFVSGTCLVPFHAKGTHAPNTGNCTNFHDVCKASAALRNTNARNNRISNRLTQSISPLRRFDPYGRRRTAPPTLPLTQPRAHQNRYGESQSSGREDGRAAR